MQVKLVELIVVKRKSIETEATKNDMLTTKRKTKTLKKKHKRKKVDFGFCPSTVMSS